MTDLTFEKAIQECCGKEKHLLLGNGFSINFDPSFNYPNLLSRSNLHVKIKDMEHLLAGRLKFVQTILKDVLILHYTDFTVTMRI